MPKITNTTATDIGMMSDFIVARNSTAECSDDQLLMMLNSDVVNAWIADGSIVIDEPEAKPKRGRSAKPKDEAELITDEATE